MKNLEYFTGMEKGKKIAKYSKKIKEFEGEIFSIFCDDLLEESEIWDQMTGWIREEVVRKINPKDVGNLKENVFGDFYQLDEFVEKLKRVKGKKIKIGGIKLKRITKALDGVTFYYNLKNNLPADVEEECRIICCDIDEYRSFPLKLEDKLRKCKNKMKESIGIFREKNDEISDHIEKVEEYNHHSDRQIATIIPKIEELNKLISVTENKVIKLVNFMRKFGEEIISSESVPIFPQ